MDQIMYGAGALWGSVLLFIGVPVALVILYAFIRRNDNAGR